MTIRPGELWGEPGALPADGVVAGSDREIGAILTAASAAGSPPPVIGLLRGDLARTCGGTGRIERLRSPEAQTLPVDAGEARVDGERHLFVAHLVIRGRTWWTGPLVAVMNAQFLGSWDVAPKSHPNDGRLDVFEADLPVGDRWKAWRRLPTGTHVPHPGIHQRRISEVRLEVPRGSRVWMDGVDIGVADSVELRCVPDAFRVVV